MRLHGMENNKGCQVVSSTRHQRRNRQNCFAGKWFSLVQDEETTLEKCKIVFLCAEKDGLNVKLRARPAAVTQHENFSCTFIPA